jgi:hypothetical protein
VVIGDAISGREDQVCSVMTGSLIDMGVAGCIAEAELLHVRQEGFHAGMELLQVVEVLLCSDAGGLLCAEGSEACQETLTACGDLIGGELIGASVTPWG